MTSDTRESYIVQAGFDTWMETQSQTQVDDDRNSQVKVTARADPAQFQAVGLQRKLLPQRLPPDSGSKIPESSEAGHLARKPSHESHC